MARMIVPPFGDLTTARIILPATVSAPPVIEPGITYIDLSGLAPAHNVPVVTYSALGASAVSTIAGSAGWQREKRTGVNENVPGASQSSTAALDRNGSSRYAYPGTDAPVGTTSNPGAYVSTAYKPGGNAQNARWLMSIDTIHAGDTLEMRYNTVTAGGQLALIVVDGKRVQMGAHVLPATPAAGAGGAVKLTFPDARPRRIQLYGINGGEGRFGGMAVGPGQTLVKPTSPGNTIAIVGDSYTAGSTGVRSVETFAWQTALRLGAQTIIQGGIGATGFLRALTDAPTSTFAGRRAGIAAENPGTVILAGGRNDDIFPAADIQVAVEAEIDFYKGIGAKVFVIPTCSESVQAGVRGALQAAAASRGVPFVGVNIDSYGKIADGVHLTLAEHTRLGNDAADLIAALP